MPNTYYLYPNIEEGTDVDLVLTYKSTKFNNRLDEVHTGIDEIHDQMDKSRGSTRLADPDYVDYVKYSIAKNAVNATFTTQNGKYDLMENSAHTLSNAFVRKNGESNFNITGAPIATLPIYTVLNNYTFYTAVNAFNRTSEEQFKGHQLEINPFNPEPDTRDAVVKKIREIYGKGSEGFVLDCGAAEIFKSLTGSTTSTSILSGVMDSSSSTNMIDATEFKDHYQVFIPFMQHERDTKIWLYATPHAKDEIFVWFSIPLTTAQSDAIYTEIRIKTPLVNKPFFERNTNGKHGIITEIPNLPDVSVYIGSEGYNTKKKCVDFFITRDSEKLKKKCDPLLIIARSIFNIGAGVISDNDKKNNIDRFFIQIKHFGDRFRAIDAIMLTRNGEGKKWLTGTTDLFLMKWLCLGQMYGCYANPPHNLILCDVHAAQTPTELFTQKMRTLSATVQDAEGMEIYINSVTGIIDEWNTQLGMVFDKLNTFFINLHLYQPRRLVRKLISIVVSKQFYDTTNTNYCYYEDSIPILWNFYNILFVLIHKFNAVDIAETLRNIQTSKPEEGLTVETLTDEKLNPYIENVEKLRKMYLCYIDKNVVFDYVKKKTPAFLNNSANLLKFAHTIVNTYKMDYNISKYSTYKIEPWNLAKANAGLIIPTGGASEIMGGEVKKQVGGNSLSTIIGTITTYINKEIQSLKLNIATDNRNIKIECKFSLNINRPTLVIHVYNFSKSTKKWSEHDTLGKTVQLPQIATLYSDVEKNYSAKGYAVDMFTHTLMEDLRLDIYNAHVNTAHAVQAVTEIDYDDDDISAAIDARGTTEIAAEQGTAVDAVLESEEAGREDIDISIHSIFANVIMKSILEKFKSEFSDNNQYIRSVYYTLGNVTHKYQGGSKDREPEEVELDVMLNRAAMKNTMDQLTVLSRKHAETLENYYDNDAIDDNAYVEYLESKIALDTYYLDLYAQTKDIVNSTDDDLQKFENYISDKGNNEVSEEKDKEVLTRLIKDNLELIAQIKKEDAKNEAAATTKAAAERMAAIKKSETLKHTTFIRPDGKPLSGQKPTYKPVNMNTGLTASEIAVMRNNKNPWKQGNLTLGYGGKRRTKTMKSRKPPTKRTKKRRYVTKTAHKKKTKNANRSKKNKTRRKRHY